MKNIINHVSFVLMMIMGSTAYAQNCPTDFITKITKTHIKFKYMFDCYPATETAGFQMWGVLESDTEFNNSQSKLLISAGTVVEIYENEVYNIGREGATTGITGTIMSEGKSYPIDTGFVGLHFNTAALASVLMKESLIVMLHGQPMKCAPNQFMFFSDEPNDEKNRIRVPIRCNFIEGATIKLGSTVVPVKRYHHYSPNHVNVTIGPVFTLSQPTKLPVLGLPNERVLFDGAVKINENGYVTEGIAKEPLTYKRNNTVYSVTAFAEDSNSVFAIALAGLNQLLNTNLELLLPASEQKMLNSTCKDFGYNKGVVASFFGDGYEVYSRYVGEVGEEFYNLDLGKSEIIKNQSIKIVTNAKCKAALPLN